VGQGDTRRGRLFVALAAIAWSTAGLFQRELTVNLGTQLAGRALFAMLGIGVFIAATERGRSLKAFRAMAAWVLANAALMAVSSGSFIAAELHLAATCPSCRLALVLAASRIAIASGDGGVAQRMAAGSPASR
jgi:hypothetical protein